jgi:hypothetical protein
MFLQTEEFDLYLMSFRFFFFKVSFLTVFFVVSELLQAISEIVALFYPSHPCQPLLSPVLLILVCFSDRI